MATITQSRPPELHEDHGYSINPPRGPGCEVIWSIDGQEVSVGSEVGGLRVEGFGATGDMSVEVTGDLDGTRVSAVLVCSGQPDDPAPAVNASDGRPAPPENGDEDDVDIGGVLLEILKYPFLPITLLWCIICRGVGAGNLSCRIACALVPDWIKKALGL